MAEVDGMLRRARRGPGLLLGLSVWVGGVAACGGGVPPEERPLLILGASGLQAAFQELVPLFRERTGVEVDLVLGSSGNLAAQLRNGAPGDLFFAANEAFLDDLVDGGVVDPGTRSLYAVGRLVLVVPPGRPLPREAGELAPPGYQVVAVANPQHAPYGVAAREVLERVGVWTALQEAGALVLGENVAQTHQLVSTGNADAGLVALGLVRGLPGPPVPHTLVPDTLHSPLRQAAAVVTGSRRPGDAQAFLDFVLSEEGQGVLARYGFDPPPIVDPVYTREPGGTR